MEDRYLHIDLRYLHIAHHAVPGQVQAGHILLVHLLRLPGIGEGIRKDVRLQGLIIGKRPGLFLIVINGSCFRPQGNRLIIAGDQSGLSIVIPLVGYKRIQQQGQTS